MTEEGKDVSFTTASGKAVSFKSKGRAKKEVVATPVETEPPPPKNASKYSKSSEIASGKSRITTISLCV